MSKAYELGLYEKAMPGTLTWKERLEAAKAAGYDYVEISIDATEEKTEAAFQKISNPFFISCKIMKQLWKNHFSWQMILESVL